MDEESLEFEEVQNTDAIFPVEDKAYASSFKSNRHRARDFIAHIGGSALMNLSNDPSLCAAYHAALVFD